MVPGKLFEFTTLRKIFPGKKFASGGQGEPIFSNILEELAKKLAPQGVS